MGDITRKYFGGNMKKKILISFAAIFFTLSAVHSLPFNEKLTDSERERLLKGEIVIRSINYAKHMCIAGENPGVKKMYESINGTKPNYLAEIIQLKPYEGNENLPEKIFEILEKVPDYAGIPYWSERNQRYWDLYASAEILSKNESDGRTDIEAKLFMEPFENIFCPITIEQNEDYLFYKQTNSNTLAYYGTTCVRPYGMNSSILLFRDGENWVLYGAGGVKAPRVPFLTQRIETSFINRIKTFCNFIFTKLEDR